jgi:hypothetical protein
MMEFFEVVHNGGLYRAEIFKYSLINGPVNLCVNYIDDCGFPHREMDRDYKSKESALMKLKKYFKGETVEWTRVG